MPPRAKKRKRSTVTKKKLKNLSQKQLSEVVYNLAKAHPELVEEIQNLLPQVF